MARIFIFSPKSLEFVFAGIGQYADSFVIGTKSKEKITNRVECNYDLWKRNLGIQSMAKRFPDGFPCLSSIDGRNLEFGEIGYFDLVGNQFISNG